MSGDGRHSASGDHPETAGGEPTQALGSGPRQAVDGEPTQPLPLSTQQLADRRYELGDTLGSGGMGIVRRARDRRLDRDVAVKLLADNLAADPVARERFLREARAAAAISDPTVVSVYDVGDEAGRPYLVMELLDGPSLAKVLAEGGPLPVSRTIEVARDALAGLMATHAAGIVHRDVKPGNLIQASCGRVKLTDLGVAEAANTPALTRTGFVIGTRSYLAPERQAGGPATQSTDLYALGVTLVELLAGRVPDDPRDHVQRATWLPEHLRTLLAHLLAEDPSHRPTSAEAARGILDAATGTSGRPQPGGPPYRPDPGSGMSAEAATGASAGSQEGTAVLHGTTDDGADPVLDPPPRVGVDDADATRGAPRTREIPTAEVGEAPRGTEPERRGGSGLGRGPALLIGGAAIAVLVVGLAWGAGDDEQESEPPAEAPAEDGVPRSEDPAETARNLAEWLRDR